jgi:Na+/proline symporter
MLFVLGLIAAAYSSADSALTALTTSFSIDVLEVDKLPEAEAAKKRKLVHIGMSVALMVVIMVFKWIDNPNVISAVFTAAGYTYGPLLGLYAYGLFTKRKALDNAIPFIAIASPILSFVLDYNSKAMFGGYEIGFEILLINGMITFLGLWLSSFYTGRENPASV